MAEIIKYIEKVTSGENLDASEAESAFRIIMNGGATPSQIAGILAGLATKGESVVEISNAAKVLRAKMDRPDLLEPLKSQKTIDTCGTGGDKKGTYNISTATAIVVASCGLKVAKHGNKSVSSKSGSADVLRELGVNIELSKGQAVKSLEKVGLCFLFAPLYHKAMKEVAVTRKELGIRTIFNVLGPLCNPLMPEYQVLGVYDKSLTLPICETLKDLGSKSALVVCGADGMDEITPCDKTFVAELKDGKVTEYEITPEDFGITLSKEEDLVGGDARRNAEELFQLLGGKESAYSKAVILNSGAALYISGECNSIEEGIQRASSAIRSGVAKDKLKQLIEISNI